MNSAKRNHHRGVVLALHEAASIHRMLEFWFLDRRFDNPITAMEIQADAREAMNSLGAKLIRQFSPAADRTEGQPSTYSVGNLGVWIKGEKP